MQIALLVSLLTIWPATIYGVWDGPQKIVTGSWGKSPGQFYFGAGDTGDDFPKIFGVDSLGRIIISDEENARIQIFSKTGSLEKIISAPQGIDTSLGWPYNITVNSTGAFVAGFDGPQKFFFDNTGSLSNKIYVLGATIATSDGYFVKIDKKRYSLYSLTGELINTFTERPAELGRVQSTKSGQTNSKAKPPATPGRIEKAML